MKLYFKSKNKYKFLKNSFQKHLKITKKILNLLKNKKSQTSIIKNKIIRMLSLYVSMVALL